LIGSFLKNLKTDDGVYIPIILRPYHEHTQGLAWWGVSSCREEEYIDLWRMTVHYLKDSLDIHHLLYAISPQDVETASEYFNRYPGDDYVDILGLDYYRTYSTANLPDFRKALDMLGKEAARKGKVAALTESGNNGIPIKTWWTDFLYDAFVYSEHSRKIAWALVWRNANTNHYFAPYPGEPSTANFIEFYNKPDTYFENDLPEMYELSSDDHSAPQLTLQTEPEFIAYNTPVAIKLVSDERAYLKYSFTDEDYSSMDNEFSSGQGGLVHTTEIEAEHGESYTVYIRASDVYDNYSDSAIVVNFTVDTTKEVLSWTQYNYDDNSWDQGTAPLGFNTAGLNTHLSDQPTVYLRKKVALPDTLNGLGLLLKGHDGFIIYFNGKEIDRTNMPSGSQIAYDTPALDDNNINKVIVFEPDELETAGNENIVAVEVHKTADDNADISFDARLFNNEGIYLDLGSDWKYYDQGDEPGIQILSGIESDNQENIPQNIHLFQNYPNPFNGVTTIRCSVRERVSSPLPTELSIFNTLGQKIQTLVSEAQKPGEYTVRWKAGGYASGTYYSRLRVEFNNRQSLIRTNKLVLLK